VVVLQQQFHCEQSSVLAPCNHDVSAVHATVERGQSLVGARTCHQRAVTDATHANFNTSRPDHVPAAPELLLHPTTTTRVSWVLVRATNQRIVNDTTRMDFNPSQPYHVPVITSTLTTPTTTTLTQLTTTNTTHQRWKRVTGSSGYRVNNFGRVGSGLDFLKTGSGV